MTSPATIEAAKRIVAEYPYHDKEGQLLYERVRLDPKEFFFRRPDGRGGWLKGLGDLSQTLYRLPQLRTSTDKRVYFCEGEKDCETLARHGFTATTSGGVGSWQPRFAGSFTVNGGWPSRDVIIMADNDAAGLVFAEEVAASVRPFASSVKVCWLPGLPEHGDISDWLDKDGTVERLLEYIEQTPKWTPPGSDALAAGNGAEPDPEGADEETLKRLAALGPVEYDRIRETEASNMGIRVTTLDTEVRSRRAPANNGDNLAGSMILLSDPAPWPDAVDGAALLDELEATFRGYLTLPAGAASLMALWTTFTHAHDAFQISPLLAITAPEMGSGKSTTLILLSVLVPRPLPTSSLTTAVIFRAMEKYHPTLLADEAETYFNNDNEEMRGVLNSGWLRPQAQVLRSVGDAHETRLFSTWGAKAIALNGKLPDTLADRSWTVRMLKQLPEEARSITPLPLDRLYEFEPLRQKAWRWAQDNLENIKAAAPQVPGSLTNRAADNARPLLAVADVAGGAWPQRAREALLLLLGTAQDDTINVRLLDDIHKVLDGDEDTPRRDHIGSKELAAALSEIETSPWGAWTHGKALTAAKLARLLSRFGIAPSQKWVAGSLNLRGYERMDFEDVWLRYPPHTPLQSARVLEPNTGAAKSHFQGAREETGLALPKQQIVNTGAGSSSLALSSRPQGQMREPGEDSEYDL